MMDEKNIGIGEAARNLKESVTQLGQAVSSRQETAMETLGRFVQEKPLAAIAIAAGVGYVLGGGLFSKTTGRLLKVGWRLGGIALAKNLVEGFTAGDALHRFDRNA